MNTITAMITQFNINADKVINQKDADAVNAIKKDVFTLSSKLNYYSNRISSSIHVDEKEGFGKKSMSLLTNDVLLHRLMKLNFTRSEADKMSQATHDLMTIKANMKDQEYRINLASVEDLQELKDFHTNVNLFYDIQLNKFNEAYNSVVK